MRNEDFEEARDMAYGVKSALDLYCTDPNLVSNDMADGLRRELFNIINVLNPYCTPLFQRVK